jgi:hypothetical protein
MNRAAIGLLTATAVLAVAVFLALSSGWKSNEGAAASINTEEGHLASTGHHAPIQFSTEGDLSAVRIVRPVLESTTKLSELSNFAMRDPDQRGQSLSELHEAMIYCQSASYSTQNPSQGLREKLKADDKARRRFEWHSKFVQTYCDEAGISEDQLYHALLNELPADDPMAQTTVLSGDPTKPDPLVMEHAKRLASQSKSPLALERAAQYLLERGEEIPAMRSVVPPVSIRSKEDRAKGQELAIRMVTCDVRGGCGPNGLNTLLWCNSCDPGLTMEQHWQQQYSPDTIAFARSVAAKIMAGNP